MKTNLKLTLKTESLLKAIESGPLFFLEVTKNGKKLICYKTADEIADRKCGIYYPNYYTDKRTEPQDTCRAWKTLEQGIKRDEEGISDLDLWDAMHGVRVVSITAEFTR